MLSLLSLYRAILLQPGNRCRFCGQQFSTRIAKKRHELRCYQSNTIDVKHRCNNCHAVFSNQQQLQNHETRCRTHTEQSRLRDQNRYDRQVRDRLLHQQLQHIQDDDHIGTNTRKRKHSCDDNVHKKHQKSKQYTEVHCDSCGEDHSVEKNQLFKCSKCHKSFASFKLFARHRMQHYKRQVNGFRCNICSETFPSATQLRQHLKNRHVQRDIQENQPLQHSGNIKCSDCDLSFNTWAELYRHRLLHRTPTMDATNTRNMPWEINPNLNPPWVSVSENGENIIDTQFRDIYSHNRDIIQARHDYGKVRAVYNFPVPGFNGDIEDLRPHLNEIMRTEENSFRINLAFGMILRHVETGELRYYTPYYNNTVMDFPFRVNNSVDLRNFIDHLDTLNLLEVLVNSTNESTKWQMLYVTNVSYFIYRTAFRIGSKRRKLKFPKRLLQSRFVINFLKRYVKDKYIDIEDNLCAFRCLAHFKYGHKKIETTSKELYRQWREYNRSETDELLSELFPMKAKSYKGLRFSDIPTFEQCFDVSVNVFSLQEDGSAQIIYRSVSGVETEKISERVMNLNLYEAHFSLITNLSAYARSYSCRLCKRVYHSSKNARQDTAWISRPG